MADTTAVALLFDDAELGKHLHEALSERGARIVHEGGLHDLSRELFQRVGADVVVINLDEPLDDALDRLDEAVDGDRPRVVFNDAESSRSLDGWDRARWARHLAAKVLAQDDVDPPRPPAPAFAAPSPAAPGESPAEGETGLDMDSPLPDELAATPDGAAARFGEVQDDHEAEIAAESESLEAELAALLSGEPLASEDGDDDASSGDGFERANDSQLDHGLDDESLDRAINEIAEPLYDGNFLDATADAKPAPPAELQAEPAADELSLVDELSKSGGEKELSLADLGESPVVHNKDASGAAPAAPRVSDDWSLVDADQPVQPTRPSAADFGIEKVSAADYLAPESDKDESVSEPFMTLELVSLEEAMAPKEYDPGQANEMMLDDLGGALTRVVLIGATAASRASVGEFLGKLPAAMRVTIVHTQHLAGRAVEELVQELSDQCALPVRLAQHGQFARTGELLVVPPERQLRLMRDGKIHLKEALDVPASSPSIDASFTAAASVFGSDALAILFAGQANDALAGCQAIHDRGGRIWVEDASGEHFADMVSGVLAEHLADFSGTPTALAARLIEEY